MTVERMDHVGVVVEDLEAAIEFFVALGLEPGGRGSVEGRWVDRIVGLEDVQSELAFMQTSDGHSQLELTKFNSPAHDGARHEAPANMPGIRHLSFAVDDVGATLQRLRACGGELIGELERYEDRYQLCYVRGPADIIIELAQRIS